MGKPLVAYWRPPLERNITSQQKFPPGWDEERTRKVIEHYEAQTEEEASAEDEAAFKDRDQTFMEVPNDLVPEIRSLTARHQEQT